MRHPDNRPILVEVQTTDGLWSRHWQKTEAQGLALAKDYISHATVTRCVVSNAETHELIDDLGWPTWR